MNEKEESPKAINVEVLNGLGLPGSAKVAARYLKKKGLKVSKFGNAGTFSYDETLIVDWKGNVSASLLLSKLLKIDPSKIIVYDKPSKTIDVTVVLGKDWKQLSEQLKK